MGEAQRQQFEENVWREEKAFPTAEELLVRAMKAVGDAHGHMQVGDERMTIARAADAMNLIGLAVVFGRPAARIPVGQG